MGAQEKSTEEKSLTSGIKRVDRGAQSVETVTKKTVQRRDKNATSADNQKPKKAVKRRDKNATTAQEEPKKKGIARSGKSGQSGHEQGLEKEKVHKKKGGTGANASTKQSTEEKSAFRKIKASKMHSKSTGEEIKPKKKRRKSPFQERI